ncbi:MAG: cyclodeaminase/cyclohydrolase family protein [Tenericutes bacterium]|jgi:methenyltetrahydrofolate cyclohydrolase|nr:cyclodeaminase/cyclohydrolase family protein [Mycoplasmatota bacterium]
MKLVDYKVNDFITEVDSKSPAPGGGSVAALSSTLGVALTRMVGHLTVGKKKFLSLPIETQLEFKTVHDSLIMMKDQLELLIDEDTNSFNMIMEAFKLPKDTDKQLEIRKEKIQAATHEAIRIPVKVASLSLSALHQLPYILKYGNKQTVSDIGVATLLLASGIEGACMNILINLPGLDDAIAVQQYENQANDMIQKAHEIRDELLETVYHYLRKK